jgi:hypothetical protein
MAGPPDPRWRARVELLVRLAAPALDLALVAADGISRLLRPGKPAPAPARMVRPGDAAPRGLRVTR